MQPFRQIIEKATNLLIIKPPAEFVGKRIVVAIRVLDDQDEPFGNMLDLSEFFGKMKRDGDELAEQKS